MNNTISFPSMATYQTIPSHCKLSIGKHETVDSQNIDVLVDLCQNSFRRLSQISMQHVQLSHIDYVYRETVLVTQSLHQAVELLKQLHDSAFTIIRARLDHPWAHQSVLSPDGERIRLGAWQYEHHHDFVERIYKNVNSTLDSLTLHISLSAKLNTFGEFKPIDFNNPEPLELINIAQSMQWQHADLVDHDELILSMYQQQLTYLQSHLNIKLFTQSNHT